MFVENSNKAIADTHKHVRNYKIGKTTYKVSLHFSKTSNETMADKIKRLIEYDHQQNKT